MSGVVLLDYLRGIDTFGYVCTVLCNPVASRPVDPDWFPYARVCSSNGTSFEWTRGEPGRTHTLPHGTLLVED